MELLKAVRDGNLNQVRLLLETMSILEMRYVIPPSSSHPLCRMETPLSIGLAVRAMIPLPLFLEGGGSFAERQGDRCSSPRSHYFQEGKTPLDWAREEEHRGCVELLESHPQRQVRRPIDPQPASLPPSLLIDGTPTTETEGRADGAGAGAEENREMVASLSAHSLKSLLNFDAPRKIERKEVA
jgi:hypothetical protein